MGFRRIKNKEQIFELRSQGKTYNEIRALFPVSKGTLSCWFGKNKAFPDILLKNEEESKRMNMKKVLIMNKARTESLSKSYEKARAEAVNEFQEFKNDPLFLIALALYWGEGNKRGKHQIRISNTEPEIIRIFKVFIEKILKIDKIKIKIWLLLYPDLDDKICKDYWIDKIGLPIENFYKSTVIQGRQKINHLSYGVCSLGFSSAYLKQKVLTWMEMLGGEVT
jgi:hypothetical protein